MRANVNKKKKERRQITSFFEYCRPDTEQGATDTKKEQEEMLKERKGREGTRGKKWLGSF